MIPLPAGVRVWLATGYTDMRKGFPSLALQVQEILHRDPLNGHVLLSRTPRQSAEGDLARRPGRVPIYEAPGAGPLYLAKRSRRRGDDLIGAAWLPFVRHRLEAPPGDVAADIGRLMLLPCGSRWM
jgi:hypothetical protein